MPKFGPIIEIIMNTHTAQPSTKSCNQQIDEFVRTKFSETERRKRKNTSGKSSSSSSKNQRRGARARTTRKIISRRNELVIKQFFTPIFLLISTIFISLNFISFLPANQAISLHRHPHHHQHQHQNHRHLATNRAYRTARYNNNIDNNNNNNNNNAEFDDDEIEIRFSPHFESGKQLRFSLSSLAAHKQNVSFASIRLAIEPNSADRANSAAADNSLFSATLIDGAQSDRSILFVGGRNSIYRLRIESSEKNVHDRDVITVDEIRRLSIREDYRNDTRLLRQCHNLDSDLSDAEDGSSKSIDYQRILAAENDIKAMFTLKSILFACGSAACGRCVAFHVNDFAKSRPAWTPPASEQDIVDSVEFLTGRRSSLVLPANYMGNVTWYVAVEPDGREINATTPFFSARSFNSQRFAYTGSNGASFSSRLEYAREDSIRRTYSIQFLYGFEHDRFVYMLTAQPDSIRNISAEFETRLIRVCNRDAYFDSYAEIVLGCEGAGSVARTAAISTDSMLFIAFDSNSSTDNDAGGNSGSVLCAYSMSAIARHFRDAIDNCNNRGDRATLLAPLYGESRECRQVMNSNIAAPGSNGAQNGADIECGANVPHNRYVLGKIPLAGRPVFTLRNDKITLIAANPMKPVTRDAKTHLDIGTRGRRLFRVALPNDLNDDDSGSGNGRSLGDDDIQKSILYYQRFSEKFGSFLGNPTYDPRRAAWYARTGGGEIVQIPVQSCATYTSCAACFNAIAGPEDCFWSKSISRCVPQRAAPSAELSAGPRCPPEIYHFEPAEAPLGGGTVVTIFGNNFGRGEWSTQNSDERITVTVAGHDCVGRWRDNRVIRCTIVEWSGQTKPGSSGSSGLSEDDEDRGEIRVRARHVSNEDIISLGYHIDGEARTEPGSFRFRNASIRGVHPAYGPRIGGTLVTVFGDMLHIGTVARISFGSVACGVRNRTRKYIICESGSLDSIPGESADDDEESTTEQQSMQINLQIDAFRYEINGDTEYTFDSAFVLDTNYERVETAVVTGPEEPDYRRRRRRRRRRPRRKNESEGVVVVARRKSKSNFDANGATVLDLNLDSDDKNDFNGNTRVNTENDIEIFIRRQRQQSELRFAESFQYRSDPILLFVRDRDPLPGANELSNFDYFHTITSGGTLLWFDGRHLDSVRYPTFRVEFPSAPGSPTLTTECTVHSGQLVSCPVPKLSPKSARSTREAAAAVRIPFPTSAKPVEAHFTLRLDGFRWGSTSPSANPLISVDTTVGGIAGNRIRPAYILYHPDPEFIPFFASTTGETESSESSADSKPARKRKHVLAREPYIEILGANLHPELPYNITLNREIRCAKEPHTYVMTKFRCKIEGTEERIAELVDIPLMVHVRVGEFVEHELGEVMLYNEPLISGSGIAAIVIAILVVIILFGLLFVRYRRDRRRKSGPLGTKDYDRMEMQQVTMTLKDYFEQAGSIELYNLLEGMNKIVASEKILRIENPVGKGHFGVVHRGRYFRAPNDTLDVAIKTFMQRSNVTPEEQLRVFLLEAETMCTFDHLNVLSLLGVSLVANELSILLPFMSNGDLRSYLRDKATRPNVRQLVQFMLQVARGMDYLSESKFVHRDLAARNCLIGYIGDRLIIKVADFGLARRFGERNYYRLDNKKNPELPLRWMAIEVLRTSSRVTTKSDVWSFGVVMWEIITRGVMPYAALDEKRFREFVLEGNRLEQPLHCPNLIYAIMLGCWYEDEDDRPTFKKLKQQLGQALALLTNMETNLYVNSSVEDDIRFHPCPYNFTSNEIRDQIDRNYSALYEKAVTTTAADPSGPRNDADDDEEDQTSDFDPDTNGTPGLSGGGVSPAVTIPVAATPPAESEFGDENDSSPYAPPPYSIATGMPGGGHETTITNCNAVIRHNPSTTIAAATATPTVTPKKNLDPVLYQNQNSIDQERQRRQSRDNKLDFVDIGSTGRANNVNPSAPAANDNREDAHRNNNSNNSTSNSSSRRATPSPPIVSRKATPTATTTTTTSKPKENGSIGVSSQAAAAAADRLPNGSCDTRY